MKIRKNDEVQVIAGKDLGKKGKVHSVNPEKQTVVVAGVNMIKRHQKPGKRSDSGGHHPARGAHHLSNVMLVCNKCNKPTRVGFTVLADGSKVRTCKKCGEVMEK